MEHIIELNNVSKQFKGFKLENVNLKVKQGYITGFIGANGAGKSTTIKLIMNLLRPDTGEVKVFGKDYASHEKWMKQQIGFVYDANVYYEGLKLSVIRKIIANAYDDWDDTLFERYRDMFELPLNRPIKLFSKGMQMKASLALALAHQPKLLIMDEPTAGLDPIARRELLELLQQLMMDEEKSIFFSSHITTDLDRIADYIAFIRQGKLEFYSSIEDIKEQFAVVKGDTALLDRDTRSFFSGIRETDAGFQALTSERVEVEHLFQHDVIIEPASLEDIMYYMKGGK
ncbi:ABC transporter ATP-binding protein [Paenibacillus yanchengensis]|uniref:ABC transporter ATP-binding protein n=1 Tax=Paenibacillus yanchengensis TaxID=2035833 RepID=A0ABW4YEV7_9BACL